ncbi:MAG: hypothetical protein HQK96_13075, partial [Nitrospirae bacterium]|nr:hypothetical protein [Nitrospirota bacterium]
NEKDKLKQIEDNLKKKRKEKDLADLNQERLLHELHQLIGDSTADIEEFADTRRALEGEQDSIRNELMNGLASIALPLAMCRNVERVRSILRAEQIRDRWLILKDEACGKAVCIVETVLPSSGHIEIQPPLEESQVVQLRSKMEKALEQLWSPPPDGFNFLRESDRGAVLSKLNRNETIGGTALTDAAIRMDSITTRLRETNHKYNRAKDIAPQLTTLRNQLNESLGRSHTISSEVTGLEHREKGIHEKIKDLKGAIGQMEKRRTIERPVHEKIDIAHRVRATVDEATEALIPLCRESLEERCTVHFQKMI